MGLVREEPPGSLYFEAWCPPSDNQPGVWHTLRGHNPFTASMSEIPADMAREIDECGKHLYDPVDDEEYGRRTRERMARTASLSASTPSGPPEDGRSIEASETDGAGPKTMTMSEWLEHQGDLPAVIYEGRPVDPLDLAEWPDPPADAGARENGGGAG